MSADLNEAYTWNDVDNNKQYKDMTYKQMTSDEKKSFERYYKAQEVAATQGKDKRQAFMYHIDKTPWPILKNEIGKMLKITVVFCAMQMYNVIVQSQPNKVAFALAILNWTCLGLNVNSLRLMYLYQINVTTVAITAVVFIICFFASIASTIIGAVAAHAIDEDGYTSSYSVNIVIYIIINVFTIVGNLGGALYFRRVRLRLLDQTDIGPITSRITESLNPIA